MIFSKQKVTRDFAKERYLAMVKVFPQLHEKRTQTYFYLILTFLSLSFLGIFAINPTVTTILELQRKVEDSTFVNNALETKKDNLSSLLGQYESMQNSIPVIEAAVPDDPKNAYILGQMQRIAKDIGVTVVNIQSYQVELSKVTEPNQPASSYTFTISAVGETQQLLQFLQSIAHFDRITTIEKIELVTEGEETMLSVQIRAYFTP